jgi:hypothetical protein
MGFALRAWQRLSDMVGNFIFFRSLHNEKKICYCSTQTNAGAVAGAECNTVIELKLEHHAA